MNMIKKLSTVSLLMSIPLFGISNVFAADSGDTMTLTSPTVTNGESLTKAQVFNSWGCTGENISPKLTWSNIPEGAKSFAVTMYDPDAPTGSGWWHWMVINIPAKVHMLEAHAGNVSNEFLPAGASQVTNDFGVKAFGGACPPEGAQPHNYTITVYALDVEHIDLPANAMPAYGGYLIHQHAIAEGKLVAPSSLR
ncbi:YbhB/YbcL family Raf kinase inhibitor-like protein [Vibrio scophthalmi]|uniref:YbhB/YbcL family Raf kinase inhibitor-like protein n=1 Tax=Vibrio scophthalmi TaxID=45658 RepID=UPI002284947E|nr:YbhB/YbcL family Raf kinase inhibitor-like protein [Vibrio scophthalmi]MCY9802564.1 YbhB/YbcL family Raf kinase inhibitor-like protein [Vibrio scophthalmi]